LATFLSLTVKAHAHTVTHGQLRKPQHTYVTNASRQSHFKMNRAFKVIQGHPYWCQQKSRTDCCHNVQQCRHYFRNLRWCSLGKTANSSISTTTLRFDDDSPRKAFQSTRNFVYVDHWKCLHFCRCQCVAGFFSAIECKVIQGR